MNRYLCYLTALIVLITSCENEELENNGLKKAEVLFDSTYTDIDYVPQRIIRNNDNEYFLFGWGCVIKVNDNGVKQWDLRISSMDLAPTSDGGCIIVGSKSTLNSTIPVYCMTKIKSDGSLEWEKSGVNFKLSQIVIGDDDEIYGVGDILSTSYNIGPVVFSKYSKDGDLIISKNLNTSFNTSYQLTNMVRLTNGGFVIGSYNSISSERENYDFNIIEFNANGDSVVENHYGGFKMEELMSITETDDDGLILTGCTQSKDGDIKSFRDELSLNSINGWIVKLNKNREVEWEKVMGGTDCSTYFYKATFFNDNYLVGFNSEATDVDFIGEERPKSGFIEFDNLGNIIQIKYIGAWSVNCEFSKNGELQILSSKGDDYYGIYNPRLIKIK